MQNAAVMEMLHRGRVVLGREQFMKADGGVDGRPARVIVEGKGRIRALICMGGNPMAAWPDPVCQNAPSLFT